MGQGALYTRIVKSSAIYSIGLFAPTLASLILLPVYTRYLSPADYAVMDLLDTTRNLFSLLVGGRFAEALFYFYAGAQDEAERKRTVGTAMAGAALVGIAGALVGCLLSPWLSRLVFQTPRWTPYFYLCFVAFGLSLPMEMGFAWLRARDVPVQYVAASLARLGLNLVLTVAFLVVLHKGIAGVLWSGTVTNALVMLLVSVPCVLKTSLCFVPALFWKQFKFSVLLGASGVALLVIHSGDRYFLQRNVPLAQVGIYSIAYKIGMLISLVQAAFGQYWTGQMYFLIRGEGALRRFARINTYYMLVLVYSAVGVSVFAAPVVLTFTTSRFWSAIPYVPWIAAAYVLRSQGDYLRMAFYLDGKPASDTRLNWIAATFCLAAYATLIPRFTLWGAVAATALTFVVVTVLSWRWVRKLRPYWLEYARLSKLLAVGCLVAAAGILVRPPALPLAWAFGLVCALAFPALLYGTGFLEADEKDFLAALFQKLRTRPYRAV